MANSYNELFGLGSHSADANLQGWWPMQDDAASTTVSDQTGGADAALQGGSNTSDLSGTGPNSWLSKCLALGSSDYITVTKSNVTGDMTYLCRFKAASYSGINYVMAVQVAGYDSGRMLRVNSGTLQFEIIGDSIKDANDSSPSNSTWYSVAGVKDGNTGRIYVDGSADGTVDLTGVTFSTTYNNLTWGRRPDSSQDFLSGSECDGVYLDRALTAAEVSQWHYGPELNYSSGVSFSDAGVFDIGTWSLPSPFASGSNGSQTQEVIAVKADGTSLDTATTATGTLNLSANAGNTCYLLARVSNTGGYDIGDYASRTSSYGSSNDGYYEIASVVAASGGGVTLQQRSTPRRVLTGVGRGIL